MTQSESVKAYREKYWSELTPDEKVERTREVVNHLKCTFERLKTAVAQLEIHRHIDADYWPGMVINGELYRPIHKDFGHMYEGAPSERSIVRRGPGDDDVYF